MYKNEKQLFKSAGILYIILLALIYLGSYLKYLLNFSWYGTASVIVILFIWLTILMIATVITSRGFFLIKQRDKTRQTIDFISKLGVYIADYRQSGNDPGLIDFYKSLCKEHGIENAPDLGKYYDNNNKLIGSREAVHEKLKKEIENAMKLFKKKQ
jgi:hypothetical protein